MRAYTGGVMVGLVALFLWHVSVPQAPPEIPGSVVGPASGVVHADVLDEGVVTVPRGAQRVPMLRVRLSVPCSGTPVSVRGLRVRRKGMGSPQDIRALSVERDGMRVGPVRQVPRDGTVEFILRGVVMEPCVSSVFSVLADFSPHADVAGEHWFVLEEAADIDAGDAVVFLRSSTHGRPVRRTGGGEAAGTVRVEYLPLPGPVRFGKNRMVARLRLTAEGKRDQIIERITLTNGGSARNEDLRRIWMETSGGGRLTGIAPSMEGDRILLTFDPPLRLPRSQTRLLTVRADVHAGISRTVRLTVEEPGDLVARPARGRE